MRENLRRPFYSEYAWAFDLLIDRPVQTECAAMATWLTERGIFPGAELLDAGCGTGRYAVELASLGYMVRGIDLSPELIEEAKRRAGDRPQTVSFEVGDIMAVPTARYDAILCRGVLNDFVDDGREAVFAVFARALRPAGVLILDVREWEMSANRKGRQPVFRKSVATGRGQLTFTSVTELDMQHHHLVVSERHTLVDNGQERSSDYVFVMRCWTRDELDFNLRSHGFGTVAYFGAYDAAVEPGNTDRLVAVAQLSEAAA